jgi:DNA-binding transcriptional ArsR family regulator
MQNCVQDIVHSSGDQEGERRADTADRARARLNTMTEERSVTIDAKESSLAPAVSRAVRILELLAESRGAPRTLSEISRALRAAKSSVSNVCSVLEDAHLVQRGDAGYTLGRRTVELGGAYLSGFDQVREFYRIVSESEVLSHELVQIAVLEVDGPPRTEHSRREVRRRCMSPW